MKAFRKFWTAAIRVLTRTVLALAVLCSPAPANIALGADDMPDRIHWVQADVFTTSQEASAFAERVCQQGFSPVCVYPSERGPSVRIGEFKLHIDAELAMEQIRDSLGFTDNRNVRFNSLAEEQSAGRIWDFSPFTAPPTSRELLRSLTGYCRPAFR